MFFKKIFGKKKPPEPQIERISIDSFERKVRELRRERWRNATPELDDIAKTFSGKCDELGATLKELSRAEPKEEVHLGLYKSAMEARRLLIEKLTRATTLTELRGDDIADFRKFGDATVRAIDLAVGALATHGRYIRMLFPTQARSIEMGIRELEELATRFHRTFDEASEGIRPLDSIASKISLQNDLRKRKGELLAEIETSEKNARTLNERLAAERANLDQLRRSEEFKRLGDCKRGLERIDQEIFGAEGEAVRLISMFSRTLRKMKKLLSSGAFELSREEAGALRFCIENPLEAYSSDQKLGATEAMIQRMLELLESGKIGLDARDRQKNLQRARNLLRGKELEKLRDRLARLRAERAALQDEYQRSPLLKRETELERAIEELRSSLESVRRSLEGARSDVKRCEEGLEKGKLELEKEARAIGVRIELIA